MKPETRWQGYNSSDTESFILKHFMGKYGYLPKEIVRDGGCARAGPIMDQGIDT